MAGSSSRWVVPRWSVRGSRVRGTPPPAGVSMTASRPPTPLADEVGAPDVFEAANRAESVGDVLADRVPVVVEVGVGLLGDPVAGLRRVVEDGARGAPAHGVVGVFLHAPVRLVGLNDGVEVVVGIPEVVVDAVVGEVAVGGVLQLRQDGGQVDRAGDDAGAFGGLASGGVEFLPGGGDADREVGRQAVGADVEHGVELGSLNGGGSAVDAQAQVVGGAAVAADEEDAAEVVAAELEVLGAVLEGDLAAGNAGHLLADAVADAVVVVVPGEVRGPGIAGGGVLGVGEVEERVVVVVGPDRAVFAGDGVDPTGGRPSESGW